MITAYKINKLMGLDCARLMRAAAKNRIKDQFKECKFLGITNGRQFCYEVLYFEPTIGGDAYTKLFVDLDTDEQPIASY